MSAVVVRFPIVEGTPLYVQLPYNSHHYTTFYHIQYVMPILGDLLGFKFLKEEFNLKNNIVYLDGKCCDLSYLTPLHHYQLTVSAKQ